MAYMNQERKAVIAKALKAVIPASWKYSLAVRHHSTIVLTIAQAPVDFLGDAAKVARKDASRGGFNGPRTAEYMDVNPYWYREHFSPEIVAMLDPIFAALNEGNHDRSDLQSDYFDVGWYVDVLIGRWNKPFVCTAPPAKPEATIWNSDGTDGPVLICAKPRARFDQAAGQWCAA